MIDTAKLKADVLAILERDHPEYGWWASMHERDGTLWISLQATRIGIKESMGYGCDTRPQFQTAEAIAGHLSNLLYHLDEKTVPAIRALKAAGELRSDYPEYCYATPEDMEEMRRLMDASHQRYVDSVIGVTAAH